MVEQVPRRLQVSRVAQTRGLGDWRGGWVSGGVTTWLASAAHQSCGMPAQRRLSRLARAVFGAPAVAPAPGHQAPGVEASESLEGFHDLRLHAPGPPVFCAFAVGLPLWRSEWVIDKQARVSGPDLDSLAAR